MVASFQQLVRRSLSWIPWLGGTGGEAREEKAEGEERKAGEDTEVF